MVIACNIKQDSRIDIRARAPVLCLRDVFCSPHTGASTTNLVPLLWHDLSTGSIILVTLVGRRIARGTQPHTAVQSRPAVSIAVKAWVGYLLAVWCGGFLWGAVETIKANLSGNVRACWRFPFGIHIGSRMRSPGVRAAWRSRATSSRLRIVGK